jgi:Domain of unknown function (DUF4288)
MSAERQAFIAILLFEVASSEYPTLYREDVTLVHGTSRDEAREEAERHARAQEADAPDLVRGGVVTPRFVRTVDVAPMLDEDLTTTADLYARHFVDLDLYRRWEPMLDGESL